VKREIVDYIEDIISAMDKAMDFVKNMSYEEFTQDDKTVYAVVRAIEIIGEAVKKFRAMSEKTILKYPGKIWKG